MNEDNEEAEVNILGTIENSSLQNERDDSTLKSPLESHDKAILFKIENNEKSIMENEDKADNIPELCSHLTSEEDQIRPPISSISISNNYNVPLLAPILFNRPPFDVEDFRRRLASIHRQPNDGSAAQNMARLGHFRVHTPPAVVPNREAAQIGLNDTPLTRALAMGDFDLSESIIMTLNDPEYLNDGEHSDTPLNIALDGRSTYVGKPRNLRIARLLVERGADANFRVPDNDLGFGQSESPVERLVNYYMELLKMFKFNLQQSEASGTPNLQLDDFSDLLDTIGLNGETDLTSESLIQQTRFLLDIFFAHGADVNLHTTISSRSIFHSVLCSEVIDPSLIEMMVHKGGLINLTDVHGTTPFMDVINFTDRALGTYIEMKSLGKHVSLDVQNCSGDCALFRAIFRGQLDTATLILHEGETAIRHRETRVQEARAKRPSRQFRFSSYFRRKPTIHSIPAVMAPILYDSPCFTADLSAATFISPTKHEHSNSSNKKRLKFSVQNVNSVIRNYVSPLVDKGWFCQNELEQWVRKHIATHTDYKNLTENNVFQEDALVPLMFGHLSSGLRQQCLRQLLVNILFNENIEAVIKMLHNLDRPKSTSTSKLFSTPTKNGEFSKTADKLDQSSHGDSACVLQSTLSDSTGTAEKSVSTGDDISTRKCSHLALSENDLQQSVEKTENILDTAISVPSFRTSTPTPIQGPSSTIVSPRRRTVSLNVAGMNYNRENEETSRTITDNSDINEIGSQRRVIFESGTLGRIPRERRTHNERRIGENWLLRQNLNIGGHNRHDHRDRHNNSYRPPRRYRNRPFRSLEGIELEISHPSDRAHGNAISESRQRVSRIRQMLEETDDMLQRLQLQVEEVQTERIARENDQILNRADELAEHCSQIGNQVAALEQFNQRVLMQGRNVLVTIRNTEEEGKSNTESVSCINDEFMESNIENVSTGSNIVNLETEETPRVENVTQDAKHRMAEAEKRNEGSENTKSEVKTNFDDIMPTSNEEREPRTSAENTQGEMPNRVNIHSTPQNDGWREKVPDISSSAESTSSSSSDNDSFLATSESDQSWGGGAFSLSHTIRTRRTFTSGENSSSQRYQERIESSSPCQEFILQMLKPKVIEKLAQRLGLPPGILPCLELEVARLQLCLAVNRYKTVECDVGCEQDESEAWDTSDSSETSDTDDDLELDHSNYDTDNDAPSFENAHSLDDSISSDESTSSFKSLEHSSNEECTKVMENVLGASFELNISDHHLDTSSNEDSSYIPSVPAKPRRLSTSSSEDSNFISLAPSANGTTGNFDLQFHHISGEERIMESYDMESNRDARLLTETTSFRNDWFSVVGTNEHSSTEKYVQEKVGDDFGHSTDSSSSNED